jgi:4-hydroxy-tetrahydrodipicolinate reductase
MIFGHTINQICNCDWRAFLFQVLESHQAGKLDTSGTAKDMIASFEEMGISYDMNRVCFIFMV